MTEDRTRTDETAADEGLLGGARALFEDGKGLLSAEIAFQRARAGFVLGRAKGILVLAVLALVLLFFALMALVVGLLLALAPLLGPWGALGAVVLGLLVLTGLCLLGVLARVRAVARALKGGSDPA